MKNLIITYSLEGFIDGRIVKPPKFLDSNTSSIKLNNHNYLVWHKHIESIIITYDLEGFIDETIIKPSKFLDSNTSVVNSHYSN